MTKLTPEYLQMVAQVEQIDPEAADYLMNEALNLPDFVTGSLRSSFTWGNTPQGHDYWYAIDDELSKTVPPKDFAQPLTTTDKGHWPEVAAISLLIVVIILLLAYLQWG